MNIYIYVYIHIYTYIYIYIHIYTCMYIYIHVYIYIYTYTYTYTYKYLYICTCVVYICTHIYIHTQTRCNTVHEICILKRLRHTGTHCNVQQHTAWVHRASKTNFYEVTKATRSSSTWYDQKVSSLNTCKTLQHNAPGPRCTSEDTSHFWRTGLHCKPGKFICTHWIWRKSWRIFGDASVTIAQWKRAGT